MTDPTFTELDESAVISRYSSRLAQHGHSHLSVGWGPKDRQFARFEILASHWQLGGKRILDIGAGFGDLFAFLAPHGISSYTGIDVVPGLVARGREVYGPDGRFRLIEGEFLDAHLEQGFDIAFISGMFNFKLANSSNYRFIGEVLTKAMASCDEGVCANFITDRTDFVEDLIFYANEGVILKTASSLTRRFALRADYFPFEFSVFLHKRDEYSANSAVFSDYRGEG